LNQRLPRTTLVGGMNPFYERDRSPFLCDHHFLPFSWHFLDFPFRNVVTSFLIFFIMLQHWSIPPWITSRSYFTGTEKSRTILTNSRWATHLVLEDLSSDMWSKLSERFTLGSLKVPLAEIGIDIEDAEHLKEIENFLGSLRQEGCLVLEGAENFQPPQWTLAHQEQMKQMLSVAAKDSCANNIT
jgi:hypothetical protein